MVAFDDSIENGLNGVHEVGVTVRQRRRELAKRKHAQPTRFQPISTFDRVGCYPFRGTAPLVKGLNCRRVLALSSEQYFNYSIPRRSRDDERDPTIVAPGHSGRTEANNFRQHND